MSNSFSKRSAEDLSNFCTGLLHLVPAPPLPNDLGVTPEMRTQLVAAADLVAAGITEQGLAQQAEKAATTKKASGKSSVVSALNTIAAHAATLGIDNTTLEHFGFAPHPTSRTQPAPPIQVEGLAVQAFADGTVRLAWDRSGNRPSTTFVVERSADGASWTQVGATGATKATLSGFAPGETAWFRIVATNSVGTALPSTPAAIYTPTAHAAPLLRVA